MELDTYCHRHAATIAWPLRQKVSEEATRRLRIYLDTRFWILLRDAHLGRNADQPIVELLRRLQEGVDQGRLLCPIEATAFTELHGQSDPETRRATARLMDRLSLGICLEPWPERARLELWGFLQAFSQPRRTVLAAESVWTKVAHVFGELIPVNHALDREANARILSLWIPYFWERPLEELLEASGFASTLPGPDRVVLSMRLNEGKKQHAHEARSFAQLLRDELRGAVDASEPIFSEVLQELYRRRTSRTASPDEVRESAAESFRHWSILIAEGFRKGNITTELPFIDIPARLHAGVRWDRDRNYAANDQHDFSHASAALPYCDMFWTERSLSSLVSRLELDKRYDCVVDSNPDDALAAIS